MERTMATPNDGIWIIDVEARTLYANERPKYWERLFQKWRGNHPFLICFPRIWKRPGSCLRGKDQARPLHSDSGCGEKTAPQCGSSFKELQCTMRMECSRVSSGRSAFLTKHTPTRLCAVESSVFDLAQTPK